MTQRWSDLKTKRLPQETRDAIERRVEAEVLEMSLRVLREMVGKTQAEMASVTEMSQSETSRTERRDDHLISTLRRYVAALGGDLEVVAVFENKRVRLCGV
jgi:DNA-binding XRE family transcriptional regulator